MNNSTSRLTDWDCFRYFLAVAETGSLSAAAQFLRVSHPTVRRQINGLENTLTAKLFNRTPDGYVLTETGRGLVDLARTMQDTAYAIEQCTDRDEAGQTGRVTIATAPGIGTAWLSSKIAKFRRNNPEIEIDLNVSRRQLDVERLEADVALRVGDPGSRDLIGRRIGKVSFGLYAARRYLKEHGTPRSPRCLMNHAVIESTGDVENLEQVVQFRSFAKGASTAMSCNNMLTQFAAMREGAGILSVPTYMVRGLPDIIRILPDEFDLELDLWLLSRRDLIQTPRVRKIMDFLICSISEDPCFNKSKETSVDAPAPRKVTSQPNKVEGVLAAH